MNISTQIHNLNFQWYGKQLVMKIDLSTTYKQLAAIEIVHTANTVSL